MAANVFLDVESSVTFSDKITFVIKVEDGALDLVQEGQPKRRTNEGV